MAEFRRCTVCTQSPRLRANGTLWIHRNVTGAVCDGSGRRPQAPTGVLDLERVPYAAIPREARDVLDEVYTPEGVEIFWNANNRILNARPRDCELERVVGLANRLADGNFA